MIIIPLTYVLILTAELLAYVDMQLYLTLQGVSAFKVGAVGSAWWMGVLIAGVGLHHAINRAGYGLSFFCGVAVSTIGIVIAAAYNAYWIWLAASVLMGVSGGVSWIAGESWLAEVTPRSQRGMWIGIFQTAVGVGLMLGPLLRSFIGDADVSALWIATAVGIAASVFAAALLFVPEPSHQESDGGSNGSTQQDWNRYVTPMMIVALLAGLFENGSSALFPSIAARMGMSVAQAAGLGAMVGAGATLLQTPAGWGSDKVGTRRLLISSWLALMLLSFWMANELRANVHILWVSGFLFGGFGGAIYTLVMIEIGHRFSAHALIKATSALVAAYTVGGVIGPLLGGWLYDHSGASNFARAFVVFAALGAASTAFLPPSHKAQKADI